jgi:hypothetical protein
LGDAARSRVRTSATKGRKKMKGTAVRYDESTGTVFIKADAEPEDSFFGDQLSTLPSAWADLGTDNILPWEIQGSGVEDENY